MSTHVKLTCARLVTLAVALCVLQADVCRAAIEFDFNNVFSGSGTPGGSTPWVTALFQDDGSAGVLLTISGSDLAGNEKLDSIYFNVNPADNASIPNLTLTEQSASSGLAASTISTGVNGFQADGDGKYDIKLAFSTGQGAFKNGDSITYLISGIAGLTANDFAYLSFPAGGAGPFYAAAHILAISPGNSSVWAEPGGGPLLNPNGTMMPEPAVFGVVAAALAGVVALRRRKSV